MPTNRTLDELIADAEVMLVKRRILDAPDSPLIVLIEDLVLRLAATSGAGGYLQVNPDQWLPAGPDDRPEARMRATLPVNGVDHHLEAWQVEPGSDPQRLVVDDEDLDRLSLISASDGPFATIDIAGRDYVMVVFPHR